MEVWKHTGYTIGEDGFPDVGELIKKHRKKLRMSQDDLAQALGVSRSMVTRMENENHGLDSIMTRRQLAKILGISPLLLGVVSLGELDHKTLYDMTILRRCYELHRENYFNSGTAGLSSTDEMIRHIYTISKESNHKNKELLEILCMFGIHGIDVARESLNLKAVNKYIDWSLSIAKSLKNPALIARILVGASGAMYDAGSYEKAKEYADEAISFKNIPTHLHGCALLDAGRAAGKLDLDSGLKHIEQALTIAASKKESDSTSVKLSTDFCQLRLVYVLLDNKEYDEALDILEVLDEQVPTTMLRRRCMIPTLQARALATQGKFEDAVHYSLDALTLANIIHSQPNIKYISSVHSLLQESPFGSSREVLRLGNVLA